MPGLAPGMGGVAALTAVPAVEEGACTAVEVAARDAAPPEAAEQVGDGAWGVSAACGPPPPFRLSRHPAPRGHSDSNGFQRSCRLAGQGGNVSAGRECDSWH